MYRRKILTVLVLSLVASVGQAHMGQVKTHFDQGNGLTLSGGATASVSPATPSPVPEVERLLTSLSQRVHSRMPASEKLQLVKATLKRIDDLRQQAPVQAVDKEVAMDYATESLRPLAEDQQFHRNKCSDYKHRFLTNFEPHAETRPSNPVLRRSFGILEGVCS